jgi:hypothetical protein
VWLAALLVTGTASATEPAASPPDGGIAQSCTVTASAPEAVRQAFASKQFQFCHEPDYPLTPAEKEWCTLGAGDNRQACPSFHEVCNNDATAKQLEWREPISIKLPEFGLPVRMLLWVLLGAGLAVLIFALVRHFLDHRPKEGVVTTNAASTAEDEAAAALARQVETDVQRLLERARAEAVAGDFRGAIGDTYAALLRRLEGADLVHIEPDQTNGDYLRKVKSERPAIAGRVAEVVDAVELAQFGEEAPTRERFDRLWTRVTGLLTERLGLSLLIAWLLLSNGACGAPRADWDHSPSGRAGVIVYLGKRGFDVHERLLTVAKIADSKAQQLVLLPGAHLGDEEWRALRKWAIDGHHSVLFAGGTGGGLLSGSGMHVVEKPGGKAEWVTTTEAAGKRWGTLKIGVPGGNYLEGKGKGDDTVLTRKQGPYAVEWWMGNAAKKGEEKGEEEEDEEPMARVLVLADDFLFRNASLLVADNAAALESILRDGGTSVELAGDLTGLVSSNPVESVKRGRLGPAMLQLAAFLLLFFVCKGARFGRPVETRKVLRREFAEHVRALGLHYARARAERHALACWGNYATERLRERCGLRVDRSLSALADAVATRTGRPVGVVMRMLLEARDAKAGVPVEKGARDLETVAELCKLLEETGGTGGHKRIQSHV